MNYLNKMDDEIIPRIKFIGKIQKGEKINVKYMNIQRDNILTKIIRSFIHTDTRSNTITFITNTIKRGFDILTQHLGSEKQYDKSLCLNLINDLRKCKTGMINIKETYIEDLMFCCKIDALTEETDSRINDIESKYSYLKNIIEIDN
jgi:hypothetical protein